MPQKKNPDSWELLRGKTGRITGALFTLFTTLKGLPTSYQRDLQEDKEALFAAHDQINRHADRRRGRSFADKVPTKPACALRLPIPSLLATDAADYLVRRGVPFRQAHDFVGQVLREAERQGKPWVHLSSSDFRKISPHFGEDFLQSLSVDAAISSKSVPGGTAEESVRAAIAQLEQNLAQQEKQS